ACMNLRAASRLCRFSPKNDHPTRMVIPSDGPERGISPELSPVNKVKPERRISLKAGAWRCRLEAS
ncbi:MAG TPA: hypothetical protein VEL77_08885, partial [Rugosimonospora sp.]|nr:hypothetical protein [Rugosimonospora sp.]